LIAHTPTLLLVIILVGAVLSLSVGAVARPSQRDGMVHWAAGMAMHTASLLAFSQMASLGEFFALILANVLRACAWAAFAEGLCEFYWRRPARVLIWSPVAVIAFIFVFLADNLNLRIISSSLVFAVQGLLPLLMMWQERHRAPGRGKYFLIAGLAIAITILLLRAVQAGRGASAAMVSLTGSSPIQTVSVLAVLMVLVLLAIGFLLMSKDRADERNRILATHDELTGLANRRYLNEALAIEWARAKRADQSLALAMIDIDEFKHYNDHYGHQSGDECLRRVAQAIQSGAARAGDLVARYGGEEFLLILPDTDAAAARHLAEAVRKSVESLDLPHLRSPSGRVTISIGVAAMTGSFYEDANRLLGAADEALYRAKHGGRNQVQVALASLKQGLPSGDAAGKLVQLVWRRAYESGNPVIDAQHQSLFSDANKLLGALIDDSQTAQVAQLVDLFIADIEEHFQAEEAILVKAGYPGVADHAGLHRALLDQAFALAARFHDGTLTPGALFEYLAHEVVARHILIVDREFFPALGPG
jgi:diguanylate cyclase (GGDEF)-like protein/hemerythrin-like metal-binding protein